VESSRWPRQYPIRATPARALRFALSAVLWCGLACRQDAAALSSVTAAHGGGPSVAPTPAGRTDLGRDAAGTGARPDAGDLSLNSGQVPAFDAGRPPAHQSSADPPGDDSGPFAPTRAACDAGTCTPAAPSCAALTLGCGPDAKEDCCRSLHVPGGAFLRLNSPLWPATVSDFDLDQFEVTVGRFRAFLNAYPQSLPHAGDGAHPHIAGSGWKADDDAPLLYDLGSLFDVGPYPSGRAAADWGESDSFAIGTENLPANRVSWLMAFAFCAWDGGRLPTEAEWNYAAAGGAEQRLYPWGNAQPNPMLGAIECSASMLPCLQPVGSHPAGDARWGQSDLAGNVREWTQDYRSASLPLPCVDCAQLDPIVSPRPGGPPTTDPTTIQSGRVLRGGAVGCVGPNTDTCTTTFRDDSITYSSVNGFRCARDRVSQP
jgi:formylglycine-generating enzyme